MKCVQHIHYPVIHGKVHKKRCKKRQNFIRRCVLGHTRGIGTSVLAYKLSFSASRSLYFRTKRQAPPPKKKATKTNENTDRNRVNQRKKGNVIGGKNPNRMKVRKKARVIKRFESVKVMAKEMVVLTSDLKRSSGPVL